MNIPGENNKKRKVSLPTRVPNSFQIAFTNRVSTIAQSIPRAPLKLFLSILKTLTQPYHVKRKYLFSWIVDLVKYSRR